MLKKSQNERKYQNTFDQILSSLMNRPNSSFFKSTLKTEIY